MSVYIGSVRGPHHNSPDSAADVWCSPAGIEIQWGKQCAALDPIAARNFAALLVRASEEVERMRTKRAST
jgi:hypothetical protein